MKEEEKPCLEECKFTFTQDANVTSDLSIEKIEISYISDIGLDRTNGGFFVIKTKQWSVDSVEELEGLFNRIVMVMKK